MGLLNRFTHYIQFKRGLAANINKTATVNAAATAEPHYTTDTYKLYVFNGTLNKRVHGLSMAVVLFGEVVTLNGEVVWLGEY